MFYLMESATFIIFFAGLVHFQGGEGGCEKEYSLYACDNDEKDGRPITKGPFFVKNVHDVYSMLASALSTPKTRLEQIDLRV
jgi:hypothetical protein